MIIRKQNQKQKGGAYAKGKKAIAICQRSGFKYLQSEMVFEPGTNYFVHRSESDKGANLVTDPLNYAPDSMKKPEAIGLKHISPDVQLSIGTVTSAQDLAQSVIIPDVNHYAYPGTSTTSDEDV